MKKKMLGILVLSLSSLFLVACSGNSLNGKYYRVYDGEKTMVMEINDNGGSLEVDGQDFAIVNVDNDNNQVTISGDRGDKTFNLNPTKNGRIDEPATNYKSYLYKEDSEALKQALKKNE